MRCYWVIAPYSSKNEEGFEESWSFDLKSGVIAIGWSKIGDVSRISDTELMEKINKEYLDKHAQPMSETLDFEPMLTSITGGRGSFVMEFSHYEEVPAHLQPKIIAEAVKEGRVKAEEEDRFRRRSALTNAFSKKVENIYYAVALHFMYYNFCRIHQTLRVTPAMEAKVTDHIWNIEEILQLIK